MDARQQEQLNDAVTAQHTLAQIERKVEELSPREEGSRERRSVKLVELPKELQDAAMRLYGLPEDINRALVIFLGGHPYPTAEALAELAPTRGLKKLSAEQLPMQSCRERGCSSQVVTGWRAEGTEYERYGEAMRALREKYPRFDEKAIKQKIYKATKETPAEEWQVTHRCRAVAVFKQDGDQIEYSLEAECCPHNSTQVTRTALGRMAQRRATSLVLRQGMRLPVTADELPNVVTDDAGRIVGQRTDEDEPGKADPLQALDVKFTDAQKARGEELAKALGYNQGKVHEIIGQQRTAEGTIAELERRVAKLSEPKPPAEPKAATRPPSPAPPSPEKRDPPQQQKMGWEV